MFLTVCSRAEFAANTHFHILSVLSHLALLYFCFQAVKAVENEISVHLVVSAVDEAPNCFSLCFETLPGAQRRLRTKTKRHCNALWLNTARVPIIQMGHYMYQTITHKVMQRFR